MKTIWEFPLEINRFNRIEIPFGAEILTVQMQNNNPVMWAIVDSDAPIHVRAFEVMPTGSTMTDDRERKYLGTVQIDNGELIFHVFEIFNLNVRP